MVSEIFFYPPGRSGLFSMDSFKADFEDCFFCFIWWFSVKNSSLFAEDVRLAAPVWVGNPRWRDEPDDHGNSEVMD